MTGWEQEDPPVSGLEPIGAGPEPDPPTEHPGEVTVTDRTGQIRATVWALRVNDVSVDQALLSQPDQLRRSLTEVLEQVAAASAQVGLREYLGRQVLELDAVEQIERIDGLIHDNAAQGLRVNEFLAEALPALRDMMRRDRGAR